MKIKAFTLAEAIVMIGILGILTAVALPTIVKKDFKTDTSVRAASKAYGALTQSVANIVQDGYYYKKFDTNGLADSTTGIDVLTGKKFNGTAQAKFRDILLDSLYVSNVANSTSTSIQFDTADGIRWKLVWNSNTFNDLTKPMLVFIDTNTTKGTDFRCNKLSKKCKLVDTVVFLVHRNGNVIIDGTDVVDKIGVNENGNISTYSAFNDEEFVKKIMGQHEQTEVSSSFYN